MNARLKNAGKIALRLLQELSIPFAAGAIWAYFNWRDDPQMPWKEVAKNVGAGTFFVAYFVSAILRIVKKMQDEDRHGSVVKAQEDLLENLKKIQAETIEIGLETARYATGGNSYVRETYAHIDNDVLNRFSFDVVGKYPLQDVSLKVSHMQGVQAARAAGATVSEISQMVIYREHFGTMVNSFAYPRDLTFDMPTSDRVALHLNWSARNGSWYQRLEFEKIQGYWRRASFMMRGPDQEILLVEADPLFPRDSEGNVLFTEPTPSL